MFITSIKNSFTMKFKIHNMYKNIYEGQARIGDAPAEGAAIKVAGL